jgi:hypothetical protein
MTFILRYHAKHRSENRRSCESSCDVKFAMAELLELLNNECMFVIHYWIDEWCKVQLCSTSIQYQRD